MQGLHEVAYTGGLSKPMIAPEGALGNLTADRLADFVERNYTPSRMVLSGAGVQQVPFPRACIASREHTDTFGRSLSMATGRMPTQIVLL